MKNLLVLSFISIFLFGCMPRDTTGSSTIQMQKPLLTFQAPPKQALAPVKLDFPRSSTQVQIKNSKVCIEKAKAQHLTPGKIYPIGQVRDECSVPAIDNGSNLYIGMTESNYRNMVNNYNILILREEQWQYLLKNINDYLKARNESMSSTKSSKTPSSPTPK